MRLFISYSSDERAEALTVQSWLEHNGWESDVFVDVDPQHGLTGGEAWRTALRDAAGRCEAVILLISRAWLASKPCWNEFQLAEKYGKPCIPVRVDDAVAMEELPREITNNYQVIDKASTPPAEFEIRLKRALEAAGAGPENFNLPAGRRPYPGLEALTELDAALLFGRDADVLAALDTLREIRSTGRKRLFALLGASGAGKSSLMRAGLWPRLNRDDRNFIALPTVRPAHSILSGKEGLWQALEACLADTRRARHLGKDTPRTRAAIRLAAENDVNALARLFNDVKQAAHQSFMDKSAAPPSIVLAVDQGEELFNPEGAVEAEMFLHLLQAAWDSDPQFIAIIAIRSDVYPMLQADQRIDQQQVRPFNLSPMPPAGLLQVIEGPARRIGLEVEPALTAALLRDSQGADALPLLAFTLERLFDQRLQDKRLVLADYTRMGGVKGAIEAAAGKARAEAVAHGVPEKDIDTILRRTFLPHLARVNEAGEFARRVAELSDLERDCLPLVNVLVAQRLLVADQKGDLKTVEIAHEAILREWPLLRGWLDAERGFLEWREQVGRARRLQERDEGDLLTGRALAVAQGFLETRRDAVREPDRKFIEASIAAETERRQAEEAAREERRQAELNAAKAREEAALSSAAAEKKIAEAARRTSGRMRGLAAAMALLALVAGGTGYLAFVNGQTAKSEAQRATTEAGRATSEAERATQAAEREKSARAESDSRRIALAAEAVRAANGDDKASALAWLALPHDDAMKSRPLTNEAATAVFSRAAQLLGSLTNALNTLFSPRGDVAVTVFNDGHAELWDMRTRNVVQTFVDVKVDMNKAMTSAPGSDIDYSGYDEGSVPLYFLPNGKGLVTVHADDVVRAWDLSLPANKPRYELSLARAMIRRAIFSHDGAYLLGITKDDAGFVWQLATGKQILSFRKKSLIDGSFSEDGAYLFVFTDLNSGTVWRLDDRREIFSIPEPKGNRTGNYNFNTSGEAHFSTASGRLLTTTAARGRDAYLWDLKSGRSITKLVTEDGASGYGDQFEFRFINDGKLVLIGAPENSHVGWIWNAANGQLVRRIDGYSGIVKKQAEDRILRLVDGKVEVTKSDGQNEFRFGRGFNANQVRDMQIDFETNSALAGGRIHQGALELWDIKTDTLRASLGRIASDGTGRGFQLSPDGLRVLSENDDGNARLWDTRSGALLATLAPENSDLAADEPRFSPDGGSVLVDYVSASKDKSAAAADKWSESLIWTLRQSPTLQLASPTSAVTFSPDGSRFLVAEDSSAKIRSTKGNASVAELKGHTGMIVDAAFSSDGALALTASWDNTARIWDAVNGVSRNTLKGHASGVTVVAFSPDSKLALTASHDSTAKLWDVKTGALKATLSGHRGSVLTASFSPDGKQIATASTDETGGVWNSDTGARVATFSGHTGAVFRARFSPNGARILTASEDHTAKVWDTASGALLATLDAHGGVVNDAQWIPDSASILTVSNDKTGKLWDAATFKVRATLKAHLGPVTRAVASADGKQVATISEDRTVRLWDVETGALLATYAGHLKAIYGLALTPDGRNAATTSSDGSARVWTIFPGSLKDRIVEVGKSVTRLHPLSKDECEQHGVVALPEAEVVCAAE